MVTSVLIPLAVCVLTLAGGWMVTSRVTDHWDQIKRRREMDLAAAADFQHSYGEFFAVWKAWNSVSRHKLEIKGLPEAAWERLNRAAAIEGEIEALLARISAKYQLSENDIIALGAVRQAFQSLRGELSKGGSH